MKPLFFADSKGVALLRLSNEECRSLPRRKGGNAPNRDSGPSFHGPLAGRKRSKGKHRPNVEARISKHLAPLPDLRAGPGRQGVRFDIRSDLEREGAYLCVWRCHDGGARVPDAAAHSRHQAEQNRIRDGEIHAVTEGKSCRSIVPAKPTQPSWNFQLKFKHKHVLSVRDEEGFRFAVAVGLVVIVLVK